MFSTSFIVKRCDIDYPPQPVCSFTCTAAVHWTESTTAPLAQWKMWVGYQQTSLAGNKVPSLNRTEEIWVIWAKERSRTEGEHKCFWHFDLPGCRAQRLINDAVCAEPGFQSHLCYTCETLWECVVKCCCVLCVYVCAGDEGSVVQPVCCGSGREEEQTGGCARLNTRRARERHKHVTGRNVTNRRYVDWMMELVEVWGCQQWFLCECADEGLKVQGFKRSEHSDICWLLQFTAARCCPLHTRQKTH